MQCLGVGQPVLCAVLVMFTFPFMLPLFIDELFDGASKVCVKLRYKENISFYEVRKRVTSNNEQTYAAAAKQKMRSVEVQTDDLQSQSAAQSPSKV